MITNNVSGYLSHLTNVYTAFINDLLTIFPPDTFEEILYPTKECQGIILIVSKDITGLEKVRREVVNLLVNYPDVKIFKIAKNRT